MKNKKETIVVIDDDVETAEMFSEMVRILGYKVAKSFRGAQAIGLIAEKKPSAIILDWKLPDMSGLKVLKALQKDAVLSKIPVIMVSVKDLQNDIDRGLSAGATTYLIKPVSFQELNKAILQVIQR